MFDVVTFASMCEELEKLGASLGTMAGLGIRSLRSRLPTATLRGAFGVKMRGQHLSRRGHHLSGLLKQSAVVPPTGTIVQQPPGKRGIPDSGTVNVHENPTIEDVREIRTFGTKMSSITPEEAEQSLRRLERLEEGKPTKRDVMQVGAVGAVAAPTLGVVDDLIRKNPHLLSRHANYAHLGLSPSEFTDRKVRATVARVVGGGGLAAGGIVAARNYLARRSEKQRLRNFLRGPEPVGQVDPS